MNLPVSQGDIYYCHFEEPVKDRPVLILSRSEINAVRANVVVALVTRTVRHIPLEIPVGKAEGLPKDGVVSLGDIHTVPKSLLSEKKGEITPGQMEKVAEGLKIHFALTSV